MGTNNRGGATVKQVREAIKQLPGVFTTADVKKLLPPRPGTSNSISSLLHYFIYNGELQKIESPLKGKGHPVLYRISTPEEYAEKLAAIGKGEWPAKNQGREEEAAPVTPVGQMWTGTHLPEKRFFPTK
jgi:hypothetical protein